MCHPSSALSRYLDLHNYQLKAVAYTSCKNQVSCISEGFPWDHFCYVLTGAIRVGMTHLRNDSEPTFRRRPNLAWCTNTERQGTSGQARNRL